MGNTEQSLQCTRSTTRLSTASQILLSTGGMRLESVRSRQRQLASWESCHRTGPRWTPSLSSFGSWSWPRMRKSWTPVPKGSWTSAPPTWRLLFSWHPEATTRFWDFAHLSASTVWGICGNASRTSMFRIQFGMIQRSRWGCCVITFLTLDFVPMEVTYEEWTNLFQLRTLGWVQRGRRMESSIRPTLVRLSRSHLEQSTENYTTLSWARPGRDQAPRTPSTLCLMSGNAKSYILDMLGDATTRRSTRMGSTRVPLPWRLRSTTSSSRTPNWAASELQLWITSPAFLPLRLRFIERRRSCSVSWTFPSWQGRTWKRSKTTWEESSRHWCWHQRSWKTTVTMSSTSKRATTARSRRGTSVSQPWGNSWPPSRKLRPAEDKVVLKLQHPVGRRSWSSVMEFGHRNLHTRGFQIGSRWRTQQCQRRGSTGLLRLDHLLDHHLATRHHHSLILLHNHHRQRQDRQLHHRKGRVHRDLRRRAQPDHHLIHKRHQNLRQSQCQGEIPHRWNTFHHWHLNMWSHIAECWRTTRAPRLDRSWMLMWVLPMTLSSHYHMSKDLWRAQHSQHGANTWGGWLLTLAYVLDLPMQGWSERHPIRTVTRNGWGSTTQLLSVGGWSTRTTTSQLDPWWSWWRRTTMHRPLIEAMTGGDVDWCRASVEQLLIAHRWENRRMNWQGSSGSARPSWSQTSTTSAKPTPGERPTSNMDLMNWDMWSPSLTSTASRAWLELRSSWTRSSTWTRSCCRTSRPRRTWPSTFGYRLHFSSQILILIMFGLKETMQRGSPRQFEVSTSGRPDRSLYHSARTPDFMAFGRASKMSQWTQPTPWGVLGSWLPLMMGCGDWCMAMPATTTWTTKTNPKGWESSLPWRSSCFDKGYCWCAHWMLRPQRGWTTWWRSHPWESGSTWRWWRMCSKNLCHSWLAQEVEYQTPRALDPIAQAQLEVEEDRTSSTRRHHGSKPRSGRFFLNHQQTCMICGFM